MFVSLLGQAGVSLPGQVNHAGGSLCALPPARVLASSCTGWVHALVCASLQTRFQMLSQSGTLAAGLLFKYL